MDLLVNSDIVNFLLRTNEGRDRRPNFVIFVVWSALTIGGWVVVAWNRKSFLGQLKSHLLSSRYNSKMGNAG